MLEAVAILAGSILICLGASYVAVKIKLAVDAWREEQDEE